MLHLCRSVRRTASVLCRFYRLHVITKSFAPLPFIYFSSKLLLVALRSVSSDMFPVIVFRFPMLIVLFERSYLPFLPVQSSTGLQGFLVRHSFPPFTANVSFFCCWLTSQFVSSCLPLSSQAMTAVTAANARAFPLPTTPAGTIPTVATRASTPVPLASTTTTSPPTRKMMTCLSATLTLYALTTILETATVTPTTTTTNAVGQSRNMTNSHKCSGDSYGHGWTQATVGGSPFGPFISVARGHSRE